MDLLCFITCGSVDDGKSTLIGRLLHDCAALTDEQQAALGSEPDFAELLDGLSDEREQGITIDVAWRYFGTPRRRFIIGDTPGHEQYTRNMVTGASVADAAVLLVDARKGLLSQTRRHAAILALLGVRALVLAVNKMDLVGFAAERFEEIAGDFAAVATRLGLPEPVAIPVVALSGANVVDRSGDTSWYGGPTLIEALEAIPPADDLGADRPLRLPVQTVLRDREGKRLVAGTVAAGRIARGDPVVVLPGGIETKVAGLWIGEEEVASAEAGRALSLSLADEVDCGRGAVIAAADAAPASADRFEANLVWLGDEPLLAGRGYWLQLGTQSVTAFVQRPKYELGIETGERLAAKTLGPNAIGVAELATDRPLVFEPYEDSRTLGGFILVDKETNATVACGMIRFALRRTANLHWQELSVDREARARIKGQTPRVVWLTGLSGAGKSTIANLLEKKLHAAGRHSFLLDGDNVRHGLNRDLGFADADRVENIRRVGEVARLMADAGLIVITAFISPFRAEREMVRDMLPPGEFLEVFVDTTLEEAERRDPKGLYAKARSGELSNFTGIDSPYEPPLAPDLRIDTQALSAEQAAERIADLLRT
ncbi:adenylyl-sulfate kinase [Sphingomonas sp. LHG3443-2]|uniref:adenylyl-sulfate kinase n=1 Tax=Sphingomonas sp. LHG3443-2 TaxID=2804639 RepID=UPI003CEB40E0